MGLLTVVVVVVVVLVVGTLLRRRSGLIRMGTSTVGPNGWDLADVEPGTRERVLLLQLSSPVCSPCRATSTLLGGLAADDPGLRHVEVDVAERVEIARALGVLSTPTTVAFDRNGTEVLRVSGVPRADDLRGALGG